MNAVLDTAVLISAALAVQRDTMSSSRRLFERGVACDGFEIVTSEPMLRELSDGLSRPTFGLAGAFAIDFDGPRFSPLVLASVGEPHAIT